VSVEEAAGKACTGATDCKPGEDNCPLPATTAAAAVIDPNATPGDVVTAAPTPPPVNVDAEGLIDTVDAHAKMSASKTSLSIKQQAAEGEEEDSRSAEKITITDGVVTIHYPTLQLYLSAGMTDGQVKFYEDQLQDKIFKLLGKPAKYGLCIFILAILGRTLSFLAGSKSVESPISTRAVGFQPTT
jgi:hypothetical protein